MLTYYFSKGSSALAAHILLEEVGATYTGIETSIADDAHKTDAFLRINPKGRIPVLITPEGAITENPAILEYIAAAHPRAGMLPTGVFAQARARSLLAYLCATAHVALAHQRRGHRWARKPDSHLDMAAKAPENLADCAEFLQADLPLAPWALGAEYSLCDPYLFQFSQWLAAANVPIADYPKLARHRSAVLERPATQRALSIHEAT